MNNLKKFNTNAEYQAWKSGDDYVFPNVCKVGEEVVYNNYPDPFWIEVLEDVIVNCYYIGDKRYYSKYSYDKANWTSFTESGVVLRTGEKLYIINTVGYAPLLFVTGKYNLGGSILSLVHGADYLQYDSHRADFFRSGELLKNASSVVDATELVLPSVITEYNGSGNGQYYSLFEGCKLLKSAPRLTATSLYNGTYERMFTQCESLTKAPTLHRSSTDDRCYKLMFSGCTKLSYIKMMSTQGFSSGNDGNGWSINWVYGVATTGTFIANAKRTDFTRGAHGIPEGWDLYLYDEDNDRYVVKFTVNNIPYEFYTDKQRSAQWDEFCRSEHNTNGFTYPIGASRGPVKSGSDFILLDGNKVMEDDEIVLNASYTIGQPTATTEE